MQKALDSLPGVRNVKVDFKTKTVTFSVEKSAKKDDGRFVSALELAGFGGNVIDTKELQK